MYMREPDTFLHLPLFEGSTLGRLVVEQLSKTDLFWWEGATGRQAVGQAPHRALQSRSSLTQPTRLPAGEATAREDKLAIDLKT